MRDADRIIGLLEANELRNPTLILNRLRIDLVQRGEMMNIEDVEEILAIDILGVVPVMKALLSQPTRVSLP